MIIKRKVIQMEEKRISELEKKVERLEKAFQLYLEREENALEFLKVIVNRFNKNLIPENNQDVIKMQYEMELKKCKKCSEDSKLYEIKSILSWTGERNYLSGLSYDREANVILVNKDSLMRAIQMANPGQAFRDIRLIDNEEFKKVQDGFSDFTSWEERVRKEKYMAHKEP